MLESDTQADVKKKRRKALMYAGVVTCIIFLLYVILTREKLYTFNGDSQGIRPLSLIIKDTSKKIGEDISYGSSVINKK